MTRTLRLSFALPIAAATMMSFTAATVRAGTVSLFSSDRYVKSETDASLDQGALKRTETLTADPNTADSFRATVDTDVAPSNVGLSVRSEAFQDSDIRFFDDNTGFAVDAFLTAEALNQEVAEVFRDGQTQASTKATSVFDLFVNSTSHLDVSISAQAESNGGSPRVELTGFDDQVDLNLDPLNDNESLNDFISLPAGVYQLRAVVQANAEGNQFSDVTEQGQLSFQVTAHSAPTPTALGAGIMLMGGLLLQRRRNWQRRSSI